MKVEQVFPSVTEKQWKDFKIEDLFDIRDGYYNKKPPLFEADGKIPFLGATAFNNGLTEFYSKDTIDTWDKVGDRTNKGIEQRLFEGNCLTIVNNGSVGYVYYQESKFTCSHDMTPVYLKNIELNRHMGLFLVRCLMRSGETYNYARKWRPKRIKKSKIYLPVDNGENPDYLYMQKYMQIQEIKNLYKVLNYYYSIID
ncbi:MAG: restriction endonuclease subunit S [Acholeplasmataceae bacterium]